MEYPNAGNEMILNRNGHNSKRKKITDNGLSLRELKPSSQSEFADAFWESEVLGYSQHLILFSWVANSSQRNSNVFFVLTQV